MVGLVSDALFPDTPRLHLTIDGDSLTWTLHAKGLRDSAMACLSAGSIAGVLLVGLSLLLVRDAAGDRDAALDFSVAAAGLGLFCLGAFLAMRDGGAHAVLTVDRGELTVTQFGVTGARMHRWSRHEVKSITVTDRATRFAILTALQRKAPALRVELAGGARQPILRDLSLNGELPRLAAALQDRLTDRIAEPVNAMPAQDLVLQIDPQLAERGGRVSLPEPAAGGSWDSAEVVLPAGVTAGTRMRLPRLGANGDDLHLRLEFSEPDEREGTYELTRYHDGLWQF